MGRELTVSSQVGNSPRSLKDTHSCLRWRPEEESGEERVSAENVSSMVNELRWEVFSFLACARELCWDNEEGSGWW